LRNPRRVLATLLPAALLVLAASAVAVTGEVPTSTQEQSVLAATSIPAGTPGPLTAAMLGGIADDGQGPVATPTPTPTPRPTARPTPVPTPTPAPVARKAPTPTPAPRRPQVSGTASHCPGTAGFMGQAAVALPGALGGAYTGAINGTVTICADRCVRLPVVDWCQCYWGTADQRVADLTEEAWALVTDLPLSRGLVQVTVILD